MSVFEFVFKKGKENAHFVYKAFSFQTQPQV